MLFYYLRYRADGDIVSIESDTCQNVSSLSGFIRMLPEITGLADITPGFIRNLIDECDFWSVTDETKAKFRKDAAEWITKQG